MKRIGIFIEHDIMIRHFIKSDVFHYLRGKYEIYYIFPESHKRVQTDISTLGLDNVYEIDIDLHRAYRMRRFYQLTVMKGIRKRKGSDKEVFQIMYKQMLGYRSFRPSNYTIDWIKSSWLVYPFVKFFYKFWLGEFKSLRSIIEKLNLDIIVHPTVLEGLFVNDLILLGKKLNIPTIYLMNSWDNPSTKSTMLGNPDKLLVWGEQTKNHANEFLKCPKDSIVLSGAAQFEIYKKNPKTTRNSYRDSLGLRQDEKLVCYAGSSKGLNEMHHLKILDEAIEDSVERVKILYRPHPWKAILEEEIPFFNNGFKHIVMDPFSKKNYMALLNKEMFQTELMKYDHTNTVIKSIDAMISPLSTIILEAAMFGIPISIYLGNEEIDKGSFMNIASQRTQFSEFYDIIDPVICKNKNDLWLTIIQLLFLSNDDEYCSRLKKKTEFFHEPTTKSYGEILHDTIESIIK